MCKSSESTVHSELPIKSYGSFRFPVFRDEGVVASR